MEELSEWINVRIGAADKKLVDDICRLRGEGVSAFTRKLILFELAKMSYLPESRKKALGILPVQVNTNAPPEAEKS